MPNELLLGVHGAIRRICPPLVGLGRQGLLAVGNPRLWGCHRSFSCSSSSSSRRRRLLLRQLLGCHRSSFSDLTRCWDADGLLIVVLRSRRRRPQLKLRGWRLGGQRRLRFCRLWFCRLGLGLGLHLRGDDLAQLPNQRVMRRHHLCDARQTNCEWMWTGPQWEASSRCASLTLLDCKMNTAAGPADGS